MSPKPTADEQVMSMLAQIGYKMNDMDRSYAANEVIDAAVTGDPGHLRELIEMLVPAARRLEFAIRLAAIVGSEEA